LLWKKESQKENKLSSILESSNEGIYGIDNKGLCTFCNHKALTLLGYTEESELLGKPINEIIFTEKLSEKELINNLNIEKIMKRKDNTTFYAQICKHPQIYNNEISNSIITFIDLSDKKNIDKLIWKQANYDSLTGIPNRFFFEKKLNEIISKSIINNNHFAILFIDLDYFKDINDNFGYHLGDKLLYQVAQRLKNCIREIDILARFGGDEFTVILAEIKEKEDIKKICSKIISEIEKPFIIQNHLFNISSSIGITCFPEDTTNFEELLQNADKAMYVAKENGRNCFNFFNKDLDLIYKQRLELSNDLKKSIDNHELELFAQPIVDSKTGKIVKAEILLRWKHSTKGYISPNEFIPISEKNGMIHPIGEWVFNTATNWFKSFLHNNPQHSYFQISINVSPLQFMNSNFVQNLKCHLKNLNLPQGSVIIEITEGILLDNNNNTFNKFLELKELGIKIAIDDFGTGYSAFSYLYKYDIDFIKIDKSFISNLKKDKNKKITRSLVSMAKNLGIQVIAEGVETHEQAKFLKDIQCEYLQGFLFSKPIPISKFNL
jgi:diguanylate cyclase (GGDEF)-like protein/PAS domain S-box-containing protein